MAVAVRLTLAGANTSACPATLFAAASPELFTVITTVKNEPVPNDEGLATRMPTRFSVAGACTVIESASCDSCVRTALSKAK